MRRLGTRDFFHASRFSFALLVGASACATADALDDLSIAEQAVGSDASTAALEDASVPGSARGASAPPSAPRRIVALGDSITETTCTTQLLWKKLRDLGHTQLDLVGTRKNVQGCGVSNADLDTEGHGGYLVTDLLPGKPHASELPRWSSANRADIALMHFGTNDVWNGRPPAQILEAYTAVIGSLRAAQPSVIAFVAQIIPLRPQGCSDCEARAAALNREIPAWAARLSTAHSPIYVVDQARGFDPVTDTNDGVHPNQRGAQKMADAWSTALTTRGLP